MLTARFTSLCQHEARSGRTIHSAWSTSARECGLLKVKAKRSWRCRLACAVPDSHTRLVIAAEQAPSQPRRVMVTGPSAALTPSPRSEVAAALARGQSRWRAVPARDAPTAPALQRTAARVSGVVPFAVPALH